MSEILDMLHREFIYIRYYFDVQLRQVFGYWVIGILLGSCVSVFLKDKIHGLLRSMSRSRMGLWGQYIEKLSEYMASTGKRYQSHAATIRRWAGEDAKKAAPPTRNRDYSVKEDETV